MIASQQHYLERCEEAISKELPFPEPERREEGGPDRIAKQVQLGMLGRCKGSKVADLIGESCQVAVTPDEEALIANVGGSLQAAVRFSRARSHSRERNDHNDSVRSL